MINPAAAALGGNLQAQQRLQQTQQHQHQQLQPQATAPAPPVSGRAHDFRRACDRNARSLVENFGALIRLSKISDAQHMTHEGLQIDTASTALVTAGETMLRLIQELKLSILLQDFEAMDDEVDAVEAECRRAGRRLVGDIVELTESVQLAYDQHTRAQ
ncbi:hypothetical protein JKP88DRAFT_233720 [Tribonema minus]|uniref:Mediator of RNA polymerase II transcription subunit 22 n=1 Tax=Tribonema minus TaxID=303371 RepID=A0A835Z826_9STRA|nr:hypothetical protein JKP88DRAFT_233720 [Tribonema minus]